MLFLQVNTSIDSQVSALELRGGERAVTRKTRPQKEFSSKFQQSEAINS